MSSLPSMDAPQPEFSPLRFSLRKLMLWTTVWAVYLGMMRVAEVPFAGIVFLTLILAGLLAVRARWEPECGWSCTIALPEIVFGLLILFIYGTTLMLFSLVIVHFALPIVNWVDGLLRVGCDN